MFETDFIVRYLNFATENAESLQRSLSHRQDDVLTLEEAVVELSAGRPSGQIVVDRAEDLRRAVRVHVEDELPIVRNGLRYANSAITEDVADRAVPPDVGRALARMVEVAEGEGRHAVDGLDDMFNTLSSTAHASPNEPRLVSVVQRSIEGAASLLERTRRAVFRIVEELPDITNAVRDARDAHDSPMGANFGTVASDVEHPGWLQVHEIPQMNRNPAADRDVPGR